MAHLSLSIQLAPDAGESPADRRQLRRWAYAALSCDAVLTLRLVGADEARALNAQFRARDYATNVLTFAYDDDADDVTAQGPLQADIVICLPVVAREAREQGKSVHCAVHLPTGPALCAAIRQAHFLGDKAFGLVCDGAG